MWGVSGYKHFTKFISCYSLLIFIARGNLYFLAKLLSFSHCQRHRLNGNSVISEDVLLIHSVRINFQRRGDAVPAENKTKLKARREGGGFGGEFPNSLATRRPRGDNFQRGGLAVRQLVCFSCNAVGINEQLIPVPSTRR